MNSDLSSGIEAYAQRQIEQVPIEKIIETIGDDKDLYEVITNQPSWKNQRELLLVLLTVDNPEKREAIKRVAVNSLTTSRSLEPIGDDNSNTSKIRTLLNGSYETYKDLSNEYLNQLPGKSK